LAQYLPAYTARERHRHDVRPGITGLAQINGRNFLPWDRRLALDVEYAERITFFGDLRIVAMTVWKVLRREDVASSTEEIDEGDLDEIRGVAQERNE
jgi:lipopolysaccharide/colanic/teichoic acid biosynthesis glycosyltransferase